MIYVSHKTIFFLEDFHNKHTLYKNKVAIIKILLKILVGICYIYIDIRQSRKGSCL